MPIDNETVIQLAKTLHCEMPGGGPRLKQWRLDCRAVMHALAATDDNFPRVLFLRLCEEGR
jgi:hypothetical protein